MLVELAIGDAYGAGFEFRNPLYVKAFNRVDRYRRPALTWSRGGRYTDDTQMTIAVAEAMLSGEPWTRELLANHFVTAFKRDPRSGYAPRFHRFLRSVDDGADFLSRIRPTSERSGAAMRAGPVGLLPSIDDVLSDAELQAKVTHDTDGGVRSSQAAALMVHHFAHLNGDTAGLAGFVAQHVPGHWATPWNGRVSMNGIECVHAAITAIAASDSLADLLRRCVDYSGDVDTVASIALAAASCSERIQHDLPQLLIYRLERSAYGYDYLFALDRQLIAAARRRGSRDQA